MAAFKKWICLSVCALFVCVAFRNALACEGANLEKIVEVLREVDDWGGLAGWLDLGHGVINRIKVDCQRDIACYRRELVRAHCDMTGKNSVEVAHDIARILKRDMASKRQADRLKSIFFRQEDIASPPQMAWEREDDIDTGCCKQDSVCSDPSPALFRYANYLRYGYTTYPVHTSDKWPPTPSTVYIKLALMKKERVSRAEFTRLTFQGDIDTILQAKEKIEMDDILKDKTRLVVVEGAPGIGKSTFAWELCRQWPTLESLKRFSLVVLLRLREEGVQTATHIADLLYHHDPELSRHVEKEVERREGEGVLFVFDGFDEFPTEFRKKSLVTSIISGSTYLPRATVLVTSRPSATAQLQSLFQTRIGKRIEIVGFSEKEIHEYAESILGSWSGTLASFKTYLSANPVVKAMMYNPLISAIVVEVYRETSESGKPIPHTQTQLYTELTLYLLSRHLSAAGDPMARRLPDRLEDIPHDSDLYQQLVQLGRLAFEGRVRGEVIFKELPEGYSDLGLLVEHTALYTRRETKKFNFFHLTHQEYLGAFYISQLPDNEQRRLFIEHEKSEQLKVVWRFVAGLTRMQNIGWDLLTKRESKVEGDKVVILPFFTQFFYEAQDAQICESTFSQSEVKYVGNINSSLDAYCLGYSISACRNVWDVIISGNALDLMEMLVHGLQSIQHQGGFISHLVLSGNQIGDKGVEYFQQLILIIKFFKHVQTLVLSVCNISGEGLNTLTDTLPYLPELTHLDLSNNSVRQEDQYKTKLKETISTLNNTLEVITPSGKLISNKLSRQKGSFTYLITVIKEKWNSFFILVLAICTMLCVPNISWLKQELMIKVGQHSFTCTHMGNTYWDSKHEVLIRIPPKAIPNGVSLDINVTVSLYGPFQYPEGLQPISPVVWVCAKGHEGFQFLKPITISLPHYLNIDRMEDCEPLGITLLKSGHKRSERNKYLLAPTDVKLEIDPIRGDNLNFKTNHFCHLCLAANVSRECISKAQYCCTEVEGPNTRYFYFYISYYLPTCIKLIKEKYAKLNMAVSDPIRFNFLCKEDQTATLYLSRDNIQEEKGWKIVAKPPHKKISVEDIEFWGKDTTEMEENERLGLYPPRFKVLVNGTRATEDCFLMVKFSGEIPPNCLDTYLDLRKPVTQHTPLPPDTPSPPQHSSSLLGDCPVTHGTPSQGASSATSGSVAASQKQVPVGSDDLIDVLDAVFDVGEKWYILGLALGLKTATVDKITADHVNNEKCKEEMLKNWLRGVDGCGSSSWNTLVAALQRRPVGHNDIANTIVSQYLK